MFMEATHCEDNSSPPLAGGRRGRGLAPAGADESASASDRVIGLHDNEHRIGHAEIVARCRAQTPPPSPSRKGRGRIPVMALGASTLQWIMIAALALSLCACGKSGPPEPPNPQTDKFPRQYPDPSSL